MPDVSLQIDPLQAIIELMLLLLALQGQPQSQQPTVLHLKKVLQLAT
jgi:hypothetical protein